MIHGPTYAEMRDPGLLPAEVRKRAHVAAREAPLDPVNLFNITWHDADGRVRALRLPEALTGVEAPIVLLYAKDFPTGAHKVGATYSVLMEHQLAGDVAPGDSTLVWPSTGNYGIGGSWVGPRMGYESVVILPEDMSAERFEKIAAYGARAIKTPGSESNVKEIYDECKRLRVDPKIRVMNQFEEMANYRWHYNVTGAAAAEAVDVLAAGRPAAFVSAMGSSGTIAAGDLLKARFGTRIVGLEPIQCPTISRNGYGAHAIEGIGDKHVTWIHNVRNMDAVMAIDDQECLLGLQLVAEPAGRDFLAEAGGLGEAAHRLSTLLGVSGVCNILGAIKTAKWLGLGKSDAIVTVATDGLDRYPSVLRRLEKTTGPLTRDRAEAHLESIFHGQKLDWVAEGTHESRERWHNLKYFTWVEQQGKTLAELDAQRSERWWADQAALAGDVDRRLREVRGW
ncbi:MAG: pyridoxal-phosphate dependent enzyme [Acidobacteria bacterium]|nr:pyridoxal-phosphate dependent enzyme [Acidobacteriota bacterium]